MIHTSTMISAKSGTMMNMAVDGSCLDFVRDCVFNQPIGYRTREICPVCRAAHEKSLSIQVADMGIYFKCFRAGCGWKGKIHKNYVNTNRIKPQPKANPLVLPTELLSTEIKNYVEETYRIDSKTLEDVGVRWAPNLESLVFPIYTIGGEFVGYSTKRLVKDAHRAKTGLYYEGSRPEYYYPFWEIPHSFYDVLSTVPYRGVPGEIYIVEDCLSCLRITQNGRYCVALLGHHITDSTLFTLSRNFRRLVICLDPDATRQAAEIASASRLLFESVAMKIPPRDPKDMTTEEMKIMLYD